MTIHAAIALGLFVYAALLGIAPCIIARRSDDQRKRRPF